MQDILGKLEQLRRPRLLMTAARIGMGDYRREPFLRRFFGSAPVPGPGEGLAGLMEGEAWLDLMRREGDAAYVVTRHVEIMTAILAEARLLRLSREDLAQRARASDVAALPRIPACATSPRQGGAVTDRPRSEPECSAVGVGHFGFAARDEGIQRLKHGRI